MKPTPYNGHRSWNAWNVSLWINNDEPLYRECYECTQKYGRRRASTILAHRYRGQRTPDGARYNQLSIYLALEGM